MIYTLRRATIFVTALTIFSVLVLTFLPRYLNPTPPDAEERKRDRQWVNSSPYWFDRQVCRYLGLCGIQHIRWDAPTLPGWGRGPSSDLDMKEEIAKVLGVGDWDDDGAAVFVNKPGTESWEHAPGHVDLKRKRSESSDPLQKVPQYVLDHAPLVHLYSGEHFWPSDMAEHVKHMGLLDDEDGSVNRTDELDLGSLARLNAKNGTVFLTSMDDVESRPEWLHNRAGIPVEYEDDDGDDEHDGNPDKKIPGNNPTVPTDGNTWWDADKQHPPNRIVAPRYRKGGPSLRREKRFMQGDDEPQRPIGGTPSDGDKNKPDPSGYSNGPAVLILVDKGAGILDAFWFFFYSYNLGQTVLGIRFGNHVGDWEHCMVRFDNGIPKAMFLSEHAGGKAYAWPALEKKAQPNGKPPRPVIYSAVGSHAMYATPGLHPYVLPFKLLKDVTDRGPLWDPALNHYSYWYDYEAGLNETESPSSPQSPYLGNPSDPPKEYTSLVPAADNPKAPTSWFHFEGAWGDDVYSLADYRQWRLFGEYHYIVGPLGPKFKYLERSKVCQTDKCTMLWSIEDGEKSSWY
ncbi:hypothetical protein B0T13DRAFT_312838 [Neurospora crassa]|nr:hypothetical protein B0T13DRAFT_312838 [Neurospora crassa]